MSKLRLLGIVHSRTSEAVVDSENDFEAALTTFSNQVQPSIRSGIELASNFVVPLGDVMKSVRQILWRLLVVGMIPFILGAGLPQMECKCAAAKGQRYCECCFRTPGETPSDKSSWKPCCRHHAASQAGSHEVASTQDCPTCPQFRNPKTGSCCKLKLTDVPTLTQQVEVSDFHVAPVWLPLILCDWQVPVISLTAREDAWSRVCCEIPPLDRVIVFEHLTI